MARLVGQAEDFIHHVCTVKPGNFAILLINYDQ